jgi:POT family proton-dependent oligopeptide transporter
MSEGSIAQPIPAPRSDRAGAMLFGHPTALTVLFLAGMWEIFALVGMRAVLVYYLVDQLAFAEADAAQLYGFSTSAAFFTALIGGLIADRYLGAWRAALTGAVLMGLGLFLLASEAMLYPGLAFVAFGNGLFKPTMLAQVGSLYRNEDPRRDRAYNVYAVGCNLGATLSPLVCGALGETFGWRWAFLAAGIGMLISAATLVWGRSFFPGDAVRLESRRTVATAAERPNRDTLKALAVSWIAAVFFWAAYGQIGGTIALWIGNDVDRLVGLGASSFAIPAAWFQSLNPFLIFVLAPLVNWLWMRDRTSIGATRDMRNMATGAVQLAVSFAILAAVAAAARSGGVNPLWVVLAIVPFTLGELYLNTIGQAMFSRLAPRGFVSVAMGIWILTLMAGYAVSGWLGRLWAVMSPAAFFVMTGLIALSSALILAISRRSLRRSEGVICQS